MQFFYIFPDGQFVPRWTRFLLPLSVLWVLAWVLLPGSIFDLANPFRLTVPSFVLLMVGWAGGVAAQLYRFARVAGPVQRQQTKWILFATATAILAYLLFGVDRFALPVWTEARLAGVIYDVIGVPLFWPSSWWCRSRSPSRSSAIVCGTSTSSSVGPLSTAD
jgi:hypothetical protein